MNPVVILKSTPFFAEVLDEKELDELATRARFLSYPKGATPIEEDGPGHAMYVIVDGTAEVSIMEDDTPVATLGKGDIVGEMSMLTGARRAATVTALTPLEVLEISPTALAHVLAESPTLVDRFAAMIDRRQKLLDRLAGGAPWGMLRVGKAEMASMIRGFFGGLNKG